MSSLSNMFKDYDLKEMTITISHGNPQLLKLIRKNFKIVSEGANETGVIIRVSGTANEMEELRSLVEEK